MRQQVSHIIARLYYCKSLVVAVVVLLLALTAQAQEATSPDSEAANQLVAKHKSQMTFPPDSLTAEWDATAEIDSALLDSTLLLIEPLPTTDKPVRRPSNFNPDGMRAVWLSALFPGLGQIYNRRYWKLPIVVGGYVGLIYATTWNGRMLSDYQQAYLDIMDSDPTTNSYMDFFPPTYREEDLDRSWLTNILKQRKDQYRYYRDFCIIGMVALYFICILDAYVDAELYHFDISPDLSMDMKPAIIPQSITQVPAVGVQCAITF